MVCGTLGGVSTREPIESLWAASVFWAGGVRPADEVVSIACDALVAGWDSPSLRILAGLRSPGYFELREHLEAALNDLHLDLPPHGSAELQKAIVRVIAGQVVSGRLTPSGGMQLIHSHSGHEREPATRLVELDDYYDLLEFTDASEGDLDAAVLAEAHRLTASIPDPLAGLLPYIKLWEQVGDLFADDDGSLPEVWLGEVSPDGCEAVWRRLAGIAASIPDDRTAYSVVLEAEVPINRQPDLVGQIMRGELQSVHVVLTGISWAGVPIPDLGLFISVGSIGRVALDYRMGEGWHPLSLGAFARLLGTLRDLAPGGVLSFESNSAPMVWIDAFLRDAQ